MILDFRSVLSRIETAAGSIARWGAARSRAERSFLALDAPLEPSMLRESALEGLLEPPSLEGKLAPLLTGAGGDPAESNRHRAAVSPPSMALSERARVERPRASQERTEKPHAVQPPKLLAADLDGVRRWLETRADANVSARSSARPWAPAGRARRPSPEISREHAAEQLLARYGGELGQAWTARLAPEASIASTPPSSTSGALARVPRESKTPREPGSSSLTRVPAAASLATPPTPDELVRGSELQGLAGLVARGPWTRTEGGALLPRAGDVNQPAAAPPDRRVLLPAGSALPGGRGLRLEGPGAPDLARAAELGSELRVALPREVRERLAEARLAESLERLLRREAERHGIDLEDPEP